MMNEVQGEATLHLITTTEMDEETFKVKLNEDNTVDVKVHMTSSDGKVHIIDAYLNSLDWNEFINYKKEKSSSSKSLND